MMNYSNTTKWKLLTLVMVSVLVFGGLFALLSNKNKGDENHKLETKIVELETKNEKLSKNINDLNTSIQATANSPKGEELSKDITNVATKFVELYPYYDIEKVEDKKKDLLQIATKKVADSIVPDDMITSSKKTLETSSTNQKGEAYSSDPTFKSRYESSTIYTNFVNAKQVQYFAEVNYETESNSGDTKNTVFIEFEVTNNDGKVLVSDYEIKYLK
ncbi:cell division protein FtsL [Candidatus Enterococcus courvalinii]|uniref:Cell division protein FtsL n=1 Tax=Candidatus Enterococcus courvalinii TaxID=2815329 RepID=A0ABS3HYF9_9ENTE|nr:cell division protein FtsL [Enterococcus sp. MSG2901]MBO0481492.1 cell division protein FtsL [Enterococcus sp. MSG2901]